MSASRRHRRAKVRPARRRVVWRCGSVRFAEGFYIRRFTPGYEPWAPGLAQEMAGVLRPGRPR